VFLSNPEHKREADTIISTRLWPAFTESLRGSNLIASGVPKDFPENIVDKWHTHTVREAVFVLKDPNRHSDQKDFPMWFVRSTIACSVLNYSFTNELMLSFPEDFARDKLIQFIKHPDLVEFSPELTYARIPEQNYFEIKIVSGRGAGWLLESYDKAANYIKSVLSLTLRSIRAANDLEKDINNSYKFDKLLASVVQLFQFHPGDDIRSINLN
jgi:hypothetical protein